MTQPNDGGPAFFQKNSLHVFKNTRKEVVFEWDGKGWIYPGNGMFRYTHGDMDLAGLSYVKPSEEARSANE